MNNVLIVDDEKPARKKIHRFLDRLDSDWSVTEAQNGEVAVELLQNSDFQLVILDIQMPGMTGFEVIEQVGPMDMPPIIFATAFDSYAVAAFEAEAIDYLLKPFTFERFEKALNKVLDPVSVSDSYNTSSSLNDLLAQMRSRTVPHVLPFTTDGKIKMVNPKEIVYLRSDDHYVHVQLVSESFYQRKSLKQMEDLLDSTQFIRIHRSTIINTDFLKELETLTHGDYSVLMKDGSKHTLSRRYSDRLGL